jgi:hypothetical protein
MKVLLQSMYIPLLNLKVFGTTHPDYLKHLVKMALESRNTVSEEDKDKSTVLVKFHNEGL